MKIIISPAKTMDFDKNNIYKSSKAVFTDKAKIIVDELKKLSVEEIEKKLKVNKRLALLNHERYKNWKKEDSKNSKQAIFAYNGQLFKNIGLSSFKEEEIDYLQKHLRIISALYGVLRPLDAIMPYRLDFLAKIKINGENLYSFWSDLITDYFNELNEDFIVNLASNEYSKVLNRKKLNLEMIDVVFKEFKGGKYKIMSMSAKKARGRFLNFMVNNKVKNINDLKKFNYDGYKLSNKESSDYLFVFLKD